MIEQVIFHQAFPYLTKNYFELNTFYIDNNYLLYTHPNGIPICLNWNMIKLQYSDSSLFFDKYIKIITNFNNNQIEITDEIKDQLNNSITHILNNNEINNEIKKSCPNINFINWDELEISKRYPYIFELINQFGYYRCDNLILKLYIKQHEDIEYFNSYDIDLNKITDLGNTIKKLYQYKWIQKEHILLFINSYQIYNREITYAEKLKWY